MTPSDNPQRHESPEVQGYKPFAPPPETREEYLARMQARVDHDPFGKGKPAPGYPAAIKEAEAIAISKAQVLELSKHYGIDWPKMQEDMHEAVTRAVIAEAAAAGSIKELDEVKSENESLVAQLAETKADLASVKEDLKELTGKSTGKQSTSTLKESL